ncbi:MAG: signal peptidase I [Acutalibacteraceae bacterium]|jgi:signal peptidase I
MENFDRDNKPDKGFSIDSSFADSLPDEKGHEEKNTTAQEILEWLDVLCGAIITVVIVFSLFFRVATIDGDSMKNTLINNDKVIITNLNYTPKQGDIVVISRNVQNSVEEQDNSDEPIIKRVIAVGGQTVDIDFNTATVYVDGVPLKEDYISSPTVDKYDVDFPVYVPKGSVFVLGDNRRVSLDSRSRAIGNDGIVDSRYILGHAVFRFFPFNKIGSLTNK